MSPWRTLQSQHNTANNAATTAAAVDVRERQNYRERAEESN